MTSPAIQAIIDRIGPTVSSSPSIGGTVKLDFGVDGSVLIDGTSAPSSVFDGDGKSADCTLSMTMDTFGQMAEGKLDGTSAFMQGKLRVAGDMGLAMKVGPILQKARG
jgi:putative sterol carrier protein